VGEPINEEAWHWYNDHVGDKRCPVVDTWWQTETGGIMIRQYHLLRLQTHLRHFTIARYTTRFDGWRNEIEGNQVVGSLY
jgi:acetyl-CoA synthetase